MAGRSLGVLTLDLLLKHGAFEQGWDKAARTSDKRMRDIEQRAKRMGLALGATVAAAGTIAAAGIKSAIDYADQLNDMNQRLGVSAEALSGWAYAAKQSGTDIDALGIGLKKLAKNMAEALDPKSAQAGFFEALGVAVVDAQGQLRDVESVLPEIASKFKELDNATQESALAMDLFGKSGTDLLEFLNQGADGLAQLRAEASEYGMVLSGETLRSADEFNDNLEKLRGALNGAWNEIAAGMVPQLADMAGELANSAKHTDELRRFGEGLGSVMRGIGEGFSFVAGMARQFTIDTLALSDALGGYMEAAVNVRTLGAAPGTVAGGMARADNAWATRRALMKDAARGRANAQAQADIDRMLRNGVAYTGPLLEGGTQDRNLSARVAAAYGPRAGGSKRSGGNAGGRSLLQDMEDARKLMEDQVRVVVSAKAEFDSLAATLAGPLAEANYRYSVDLAKLNELATKGEVSTQELALAQSNLRSEHEANVAAIQKQLNPLATLVADIQFENALMGQGSVARQMAIATRGMDADAIARQSAALADLKDAFTQSDLMREQIGLMDDYRESVRGIFSDVYRGKNAWDAVKDAFDNFADAIFDFSSRKVIEQLFGQMGTSQSGSAGGGLAGLFQSFLGAWSGGGFAASSGGVSGADFASVFDNFMGGYANGGILPARSFAEVNERGLEMMTVRGRDYLMTGLDPVKITPNHMLRGNGGGVTVNQTFVNPRMYDRRSESQRAADSAMQLRNSTRFA